MEETVLLKFEIDQGAAVTSIESLRKANSELNKERNKVNIGTEEGRKKVQDLNKAIDKNNATIKTNVSALDKQRLNVGNYTEAINESIVSNLKNNKAIVGAKGSLDTLAPGLSSSASGFLSMAKAAMAFIAAPIGAVIAALVAAFSLLKSAVSTNNAVFDKFENITHAIGVVMDVILNRVGKLGEALIDLASGNFSGAIDKTKEAFAGLGDEIGRATTAGQLYLDLSRELEDSQRAIRIETAKQTNEISKLVVAAKNRNLTSDEQEALLRRALALEKALVEQRTDLARRELVIAAKQISQSKRVYQTNEENFDQFVDRLIGGSKLADEEVNKIVDKVVDLENARGDSLAFQEKVANQIEAIQIKRESAQIKREAAALERAEAVEAERVRILKAREDEGNVKFNDTPTFTEPTIDPTLINIKAREKAEKDHQKVMESIFEKREGLYVADRLTYQQQSDLKTQIDQAEIDLTINALGTAASLFEEKSAEYKVLASAQTLVSTYSAAQKSYDSLASIPVVGPALGAAAAAIAIASGLANVAKINSVQFAEGGFTGHGGKYEPAGIVHKGEYVVPQSVNYSPAARPHISALENMRTKGYSDGGFVTNKSTSSTRDSLLLANAVKNLPRPIVDVREISTAQSRIEVKQNISKL